MSFVNSILGWFTDDSAGMAGGFPGGGGFGGWDGTGKSDFWWQQPWLWLDPTNWSLGNPPQIPGINAGINGPNLPTAPPLYGGMPGSTNTSSNQTGGGAEGGTPTGTGGTGGSAGTVGNTTPPPVQTTDITGKPIKSDAIVPGVVPPISPQLQNQWMAYLLGQIGQGLPSFPGPLNTPIDKTRLPDVWNSWQPWDGGTQAIANNIGSWLNPDYDPLLTFARWYGGYGGPGHKGVNDQMMFGGAGKDVTQPLSLARQFGVTGEAVGRPLADMAYGRGVGTQFLMPILMGQSPVNYSAPMIPPTAFKQPDPTQRKG